LVFDFKNNYFRKSATDSTFGASITHAATTNATMTDGYGPDVVTNGDFASDSGWDKGTGWTISGGVATHSGGTDGNLNNTGYTVSAPSNKTVTITYTISGHTAGSVRVGLAGGNAQLLTFKAANGTYTESVTNTGGNLYVRFQTAGFLGSIDNVSVRQSPALKWRPHNILTHSGDLTNAGWINNGLTVTTGQNDFEGNPTAFKITPTTASNTHQLYKSQVSSNLVNGILTTVTIDLKADGYNFFSVATTSGRYAIINLSDGTVSLDTGSVSPTVTSLGNGWYRFSITTSALSQEVFSVGETSQANGFGSQTFTGDGTSGVLVAYPHSIRSDLGGMVNNPDRGDSYVPTTTTPVYLSRRGHHIYNGDAWVNEGILHESEARTNQMIYSSNLAGPSGWTGGALAGTVTAGSPFGTYQTLSPNSSNTSLGPAQIYQIGKPITSGATYVGWALVKYSVGSGWFALNMYDTGKANEQVYFDVQNGVVGYKQALIIDHGMVDYGDGWWLCWASSNAASGSGGLSLEMPNGDGVQSCTATDVVLIAGSQFEQGSTPSSYIPTTTTTVTRAAETLTVPAANLPYPTTYVETTGTELVTNGTFDTDLSGWVASHGASTQEFDNGTIKLQHTGYNSYSRQYLTGLVVGTSYQVNFSVTNDTQGGGGGSFVGIWENNSDSSYIVRFTYTRGVVGSYTFTFTATSTASQIRLTKGGNTGVTNFDNISVKEINPLALSIQIDGKMTYADTGAGLEVQQYRWQLTATDYISTNMQTVGGRTGQPVFSQRQSTSGLDQAGGGNNAYSPDTNVPFNIASRHGSTFINGAHEGTLLTANTTPTILPALSSTDLDLGNVFMGTIGQFRMWDEDITDAGITEAST